MWTTSFYRSFSKKYFVVQEQSAAKNSFSTYAWSKVDSCFCEAVYNGTNYFDHFINHNRCDAFCRKYRNSPKRNFSCVFSCFCTILLFINKNQHMYITPTSDTDQSTFLIKFTPVASQTWQNWIHLGQFKYVAYSFNHIQKYRTRAIISGRSKIIMARKFSKISMTKTLKPYFLDIIVDTKA